MTKKDWVRIANIIEVSREITDGENREVAAANAALFYFAGNLAKMFASHYPRFDRVLFLEAAGGLPYAERVELEKKRRAVALTIPR